MICVLYKLQTLLRDSSLRNRDECYQYNGGISQSAIERDSDPRFLAGALEKTEAVVDVQIRNIQLVGSLGACDTPFKTKSLHVDICQSSR